MKNFEKFVQMSFRKTNYEIYPITYQIGKNYLDDGLKKFIAWDSEINLIVKIDLGKFTKKLKYLFKEFPGKF